MGEVVIGYAEDGPVMAKNFVDVLADRIQAAGEAHVDLSELLLTPLEYQRLVGDMRQYNDKSQSMVDEGEPFTLWGLPVRMIEQGSESDADSG